MTLISIFLGSKNCPRRSSSSRSMPGATPRALGTKLQLASLFMTMAMKKNWKSPRKPRGRPRGARTSLPKEMKAQSSLKQLPLRALPLSLKNAIMVKARVTWRRVSTFSVCLAKKRTSPHPRRREPHAKPLSAVLRILVVDARDKIRRARHRILLPSQLPRQTLRHPHLLLPEDEQVTWYKKDDEDAAEVFFPRFN